MSTRRWSTTAAVTIAVCAPFAIRKRDGWKVIVTPDGAPEIQPEARPPRIEHAMVKTLARAFCGERMLESGDSGSIGLSRHRLEGNRVVDRHGDVEGGAVAMLRARLSADGAVVLSAAMD